MLYLFERVKTFFAKKNTSHDFIYTCFQNALEKRSSIFLDFLHSDRVAYQTKAICVELTNTSIRFLLRNEQDYIPAKNMSLSCFFLTEKDHKKIPCTFATQVITTYKKENEIFVEVDIPVEVVHEQRRNNVRIPITEHEIPNFQIWSGREMETLQDNERRNKFVWDIIEKDHVQLIDISAGGIMLSISKEYDLYRNVKLNSLFLCSGNFYCLNKPETSLMLIAKVKRISTHEKDAQVILGLQFVRWAQVSEQGTSWVNVDEAGVSFLGSWIAPLIIKFSREKKVDDTLD